MMKTLQMRINEFHTKYDTLVKIHGRFSRSLEHASSFKIRKGHNSIDNLIRPLNATYNLVYSNTLAML